MKRLIILLLIVGCEEPSQHGCLDSQACNYDSGATIDNNSCEYVIDCDGICGGDNLSCADCNGEINGTATFDNCETCDSNSTNDCEQDCDGIWGGNAVIDDCGNCISQGGEAGNDLFNYAMDECGVCNGNGCYLNDCDNYPTAYYDCDGNCVIPPHCP